MNWDNGSVAWDEEKGEWGIVPQRLVLAYGPRYICRDIAAEVRDGRLHVLCPNPGLDDPHAVGDDRLSRVGCPCFYTEVILPVRDRC